MANMSFAARLFYNNQNWTRPANADQGHNYGVNVSVGKKLSYRFGFEEWLFHEISKKFKIGFLECYRHSTFSETADKILLYTKHDSRFFHVGNLYDVAQIKPQEIDTIRRSLIEFGWEKIIEEHFCLLGDCRQFNLYKEYLLHWLSDEIIKNRKQQGFCFNIRYKKAELFSPNKYINLSALDNQNSFYSDWNHLSIRYIINNKINKLGNKNPLKKYLQNQ